MQGISPYVPYVQAYRHPFKLSVGSDTANQQKFPADAALKNAANLTLELQVSLALSELMLLNTAQSPGARTSTSFPIEYYWFGAGTDELD